MRTRRSHTPGRRAQAWLWTGPVGHFVGGALDLLAALAGYALLRVRDRAAHWARPRIR